ncbi:hypothetical protein SKAU_G00243840 [Synaphobranchus kaupii]|uniref:Beta/gamma crystallin 'Greek key' domain-containing protein n=1 Tax=Synaphobranchus kaupii TaxID=118154 RepID=A0A9Q1F868_SYNKA|nr:hypothetical protein SKAU_G00243840 [Synaphobranchus kaupii]
MQIRECSSDCADLRTYFSHRNSVRVESGCWELYERPNYAGYQYILPRGGVYGNSYKLRDYERPNFGGQMVEHAEDCLSVQEAFSFGEIHSCAVTADTWVFYELPNYRGCQYFLERGDYRQHTDRGAASPAVGSFHRITEF